MSTFGPRHDPQGANDVDQQIEPPRMYRVFLHNDHYTTMDFVVAVLEDIFRKPREEAVRIMLNVHHTGLGVCGIYAAEVAETKVTQVYARAQTHGFPLKCSMTPE